MMTRQEIDKAWNEAMQEYIQAKETAEAGIKRMNNANDKLKVLNKELERIANHDGQTV